MQTYLHRTCWLLTGALLTATVVTGIAKAQSQETKEANKDEYYELMSMFVDTFAQIDRNYVKEVDRRKLVEAAVRGMLAELDPYSDFIAPDDLDEFTEAISQEFGGVGIRVSSRYDNRLEGIEVITPLPGSPAYNAGVQAGDVIVEIAGKLVKDFPANEKVNKAIELLRGRPKETIEVGLRHGKSEEVRKVTLTREIIQLDTVMGYSYDKDGKWNLMLDPEKKIGYLRLTHFTKRSASEVREALRTLKKNGMKGLILDLRFNPGGLLDAAVDIADLFVEKGVIVSTDGRNSRPRTWTAKSSGTFTGFPMAVIINHSSASASEILSACLQDYHRAVVIGERSFGKGSVQDVIDLEDGKSALKLTTAKYHRPSGKNIHRDPPNAPESEEWGVTPDEGYKVDFTPEETLKSFQDRRERDVLGREEEFHSDFVDSQLEAARKYIEEQLDKKESPQESAPAAEQPAPKPEEHKTSIRFPFILVPRERAA